MMRTTRLMLAAWALSLGGCTVATFQSPPTALQNCDERLVGDWQMLPRDETSSDERAYLRVAAGCRQWLGLEISGQAQEKIKLEDLAAGHALKLAHVGAWSVLVALESTAAATAHAEPAADADPAAAATEAETAAVTDPDGYVLFRYDTQDDGTVAVFEIDSRVIAHRIIDGDLVGWVDKRDRLADGSGGLLSRRFRVHVFGDSAATEAALRPASVWVDEPLLRLRPLSEAERAKLAPAWAQGATPAAEPQSGPEAQ